MDEVPLNHFFLTVDRETYKAIESSTFLREEFAPFEQRTTVRKDMTYTGSYFYGDRSYFEFFEVGASIGRAVGASAVAFASEVAGASPQLRDCLEEALGTTVWLETITRRVGERDIEWFFMTSVGERSTPAVLQTWIMEYCGTFLGAWYPELKPESRGITRAEI